MNPLLRRIRWRELRGRSECGPGFARSESGAPAPVVRFAAVLGVALSVASGSGPFATALVGQEVADRPVGPVGPRPYEVVSNWHEPFEEEGFVFGGDSGVFAESPDRIFIAQRGVTRLPDPVPPEYDGHAGSLGINALTDTARRVWRHCLYAVDGDGRLLELWDRWDHLQITSSRTTAANS